MALYAIGDPHLSLGEKKPMDIFRGWRDYVSRLERNWCSLVRPEDTVVIAGDVSWAMKLSDCGTDFAFLNRLPGKKLLLKGNHDYWWTTRKKMDAYLDAQGFDTLSFIHNSAEVCGNFAVCGTRGWFFDAEPDADKKVLMREVGRLNTSIEAAKATGKEPVVFLHYPPVVNGAECTELMDVLRTHQITRCYYGHLHGPSIRRAVQEKIDGIEFKLISCDAVNFTPVLVR